MRRVAVAGLMLLTGCGCDYGVTGDAFPIDVDMSTGPIIASVVEGDGTPRQAVIDLLAPFTVLDAPADAAASRRCTDLTLLDTGAVPRAHLELTVNVFNACGEDDACVVGDDTGTTPIEAVIGGDAFAPGAARFDFVTGQVTLFPDIAGDGPARGELCEAQVPDPFRGGGTLAIGGSEISFSARRIAIGACLAHDPELDPELATDGGADVQLVISTGIGPTILSEDAYQRFLVAAEETDPLLGPATVWMPSGPIEGRLASISRLALVGGYDDQRGPCRQVFAHHLLSIRDCDESDDCPCPDGRICRVPSIVEIDPSAVDPLARIPVVVVADDHPVLQALRTELRPRTAEVDGILGTAVLAPTSIDVDPPNNRVLIRCEAAGCVVRPELITDDLRGLISDCLDRAATL